MSDFYREYCVKCKKELNGATIRFERTMSAVCFMCMKEVMDKKHIVTITEKDDRGFPIQQWKL